MAWASWITVVCLWNWPAGTACNKAFLTCLARLACLYVEKWLKILYNQAITPQRASPTSVFFWPNAFSFGFDAMSANLHTLIGSSVQGLGLELVEIERSAGGLLRVTIDHPWEVGQEEQLINVEDCERVTRQLQYLLEVEGVDYKRLEVASPGIDRPLLVEKDFERFSGEMVDLTLKVAIGPDAR
jgi:ribosome maturation factor RimP